MSDILERAESHRGLVRHLAHRYRGHRVPVEELVAEGNLGLVEAAHRFDPARGVLFTTYATYWVRKRMLLALERAAASRPARSLHEPAGEGRRTLVDVIADPAWEHPLEDLGRRDAVRAVRRALASLSPREREVLRLRHGFDGSASRSLHEVARLKGCSAEWIRQVEARALERLRRRLHLFTSPAGPAKRQVRS